MPYPAHVHLVTFADPERHRVVIVRVELLASGNELMRIELLEVSPHAATDRLLGRAVDADGTCRVLNAWFGEVSAEALRSATDPTDA